MRAEPDAPSACPLREPTIRFVLERLVTVEFRPISTSTPELDGLAHQSTRVALKSAHVG
jgi:hypothetical protein